MSVKSLRGQQNGKVNFNALLEPLSRYLFLPVCVRSEWIGFSEFSTRLEGCDGMNSGRITPVCAMAQHKNIIEIFLLLNLSNLPGKVMKIVIGAESLVTFI